MGKIKRRVRISDNQKYENIKVMFDTIPYVCHLWNRDFKMIDCNEVSLRLFNLSRKEEFIERFYEFSPEYQPDGALSSEKAVYHLARAFEDGKNVFPWMHVSADGGPIPCIITTTRVKLRGDDFVVAYLSDQSE